MDTPGEGDVRQMGQGENGVDSCVGREGETERDETRKTERAANRQTDRQTEGQTDRTIKYRKSRETDRRKDVHRGEGIHKEGIAHSLDRKTYSNTIYQYIQYALRSQPQALNPNNARLPLKNRRRCLLDAGGETKQPIRKQRFLNSGKKDGQRRQPR